MIVNIEIGLKQDQNTNTFWKKLQLDLIIDPYSKNIHTFFKNIGTIKIVVSNKILSTMKRNCMLGYSIIVFLI